MPTDHAIRTLLTLAHGADPRTGEVLPAEHVCHDPEVIRALFEGVRALERRDGAPTETLTREEVDALLDGAEEAAGEQPAEDAAPGQPDEPFPPVDSNESSASPPPKTVAPPPRRAGDAWTEEEDEKLAQRFDEGMTVQDLAEKHHRSCGAIRSRLARLGRVPKPAPARPAGKP